MCIFLNTMGGCVIFEKFNEGKCILLFYSLKRHGGGKGSSDLYHPMRLASSISQRRLQNHQSASHVVSRPSTNPIEHQIIFIVLSRRNLHLNGLLLWRRRRRHHQTSHEFSFFAIRGNPSSFELNPLSKLFRCDFSDEFSFLGASMQGHPPDYFRETFDSGPCSVELRVPSLEIGGIGKGSCNQSFSSPLEIERCGWKSAFWKLLEGQWIGKVCDLSSDCAWRHRCQSCREVLGSGTSLLQFFESVSLLHFFKAESIRREDGRNL